MRGQKAVAAMLVMLLGGVAFAGQTKELPEMSASNISALLTEIAKGYVTFTLQGSLFAEPVPEPGGLFGGIEDAPPAGLLQAIASASVSDEEQAFDRVLSGLGLSRTVPHTSEPISRLETTVVLGASGESERALEVALALVDGRPEMAGVEPRRAKASAFMGSSADKTQQTALFEKALQTAFETALSGLQPKAK